MGGPRIGRGLVWDSPPSGVGPRLVVGPVYGGSPKMVRPGYRRYPKFRRSQGTGGLIYT